MTESHTAGSQPTPGIFLHLTCSKAIISSICSCKTEMIMGKLSIRHPRCRQKLRNDNDKVVTASLKNTTRTKDDNEKVVYQTKNNEKVVDQQKSEYPMFWSRRDSNSPLSDCEPDALPDELRPHIRIGIYQQRIRNAIIIPMPYFRNASQLQVPEEVL